MTTWETAVCQRSAVEAFGKEHQLIICMEEMAELTKELTKHLRGVTTSPRLQRRWLMLRLCWNSSKSF